MDAAQILPTLLGLAVLAPLASFWLIFLFGVKMGRLSAYMATSALVFGFILSLCSLVVWVSNYPPSSVAHHAEHNAADHKAADKPHHGGEKDHKHDHKDHAHGGAGHDADHGHAGGHEINKPAAIITGNWYVLGTFGKLQLTIGYYIDALTIVMFCMVTLIASCIHFYAIGYMHDEEHDITDHEVTLPNGKHLHRPGRYHRFFQALSLFCFSMLGLVIAGNVAMTFVFWELVGICSYFLIGFYVERQSASNAANKAFIVNRVGDFGMIIGLMALWSGLGTFNYGDIDGQPGVFSQIRTEKNDYQLATPAGMVKFAAAEKVAAVVAEYPAGTPIEKIEADVNAHHVAEWRDGKTPGDETKYGYWLLIVAGVGIFCGCVGKSAQFPLHVWLPDAMEGPTPVSALVHSATMVAAGVFLVARFYPAFAPEVLLVIAIIGTITLFMAATIAITATDIKRVLAYSTVSQLGYMMMALGVGAWVAGVMHLITHAFFKSLLFMGSGSVIHAVHTNEMPQMGGLRKKMPITAYTMLIGCLAIAGAGIPFALGPLGYVGFSGFYSKDSILEHAWLFGLTNGGWRMIFFYVAAAGATITAFYMFRMWFMTFAGKPRDHHRYDHAHESPRVMTMPLIITSVFAVAVAWPMFDLSLVNLLEQARPAGTLAEMTGQVVHLTWPNEHDGHADAIKIPVTWIAFFTALSGIGLAAAFYGLKLLDPAEVKKQFSPIYKFLVGKWWFDELYDRIFIRPTHVISRMIAGIDKNWIDGLLHGIAWCGRKFSVWLDAIVDQGIIDGLVNSVGRWTHSTGLYLRKFQTGRLRQYVMFIVVGTVAMFILISFFWRSTLAG